MGAKVKFPISERLTGVSVVEDGGGHHELHLSEVKLFFQTYRVTLRPVAETDEVEITAEPLNSLPNINETPDWCRPLLGKMLHTVWVCDNSQNYQDMVVFAFERLHPTLTFVAECSVLIVFRSELITKELVNLARLSRLVGFMR